MPREAGSSQSGKSIEAVGAELAGHVASAIAAAGPGGAAPEIRVAGADPDAAAGLPVSGQVDIGISYKETTFTLTGKLPGSDSEGEYLFILTMQRTGEPKPKELAKFIFLDKDNWLVSAGLTNQPIGPVTIKEITVSVYKGNPPTPPPTPTPTPTPTPSA